MRLCGRSVAVNTCLLLDMGLLNVLESSLVHPADAVRYEAVGLVYWLAQERTLGDIVRNWRVSRRSHGVVDMAVDGQRLASND